MSRPSVLIVGGGFAGLACANALDSSEFAVTLIDARPDFEFLPNIHELLSGVKKPAQLRLPLNEALDASGHAFVHGEVRRVDPEARSVELGPRRRLQADYLVIALGSADADFGISGVREHSLGFKSVAQCQAIQRRLAALAASAKQGKRPPEVVIIGGGLEGVEALGEVLRRYRDTALRLSIIEAQSRLLPGASQAVSRHLQELCADWQVDCITGDPVARITPKTVLLESGRRLRSAATIWTGGPKPPPLLAESGLAPEGEWVRVGRDLAHPDYPGVFIAGDAAETEPAISKQAYHALDMGHCVADNIQRAVRGKRSVAYRASGKPTLLAFGDLDTVLSSDSVSLAGPPLAAAKEGVFNVVMAQLDSRAARTRVDAALKRGREATRQLLWPTLASWSALKRQAKVERLK